MSVLYINGSCKKRKLDMDANNVISAFIASSNQYIVLQNEKNLMQLQRHLEILVCLTTSTSDLAFFQSGNPLVSQCITHVVNLLLDNNVKSSLIPRALSVLQNLSKCSQINKKLTSIFHVHSAISVFLQHYGIDVKDPLVLECLNLLEKLTYDVDVDYLASHSENLIDALLKLTDTDSLQLLKVALKILMNLARRNVAVQNYICSLPNAKQYIKKIVSLLNTGEPNVLVYALSILANLSPNYPVVAKLWTDEHLMSTFQIIIKLLFGSDESSAGAALDLFFDLMKVPKYQSCFIKSPHLNTFLKRIPKVLNNSAQMEQSVVYLQILFVLIKIPDCSKKVCSALCVSCKSPENESNSDIMVNPKIVDWCVSPDQSNEKAHQISLKLLKCILSINMDADFSVIENATKEILKNLLSSMSVPVPLAKDMLDRKIESYVSLFEIIILLFSRTQLKQFLSQYLNENNCLEMANMLLDKCKPDEFEINISYVHLFLMVLEVLSETENIKPESIKVLSKVLNDNRAMQFLAYALSSSNTEYVKRSLLLVSFVKNKNSLNELGKILLVRNSNMQKRMNSELQDSSCISDAGCCNKNQQSLNDSLEKSIDSLLVKIEQGLSVKDLKRSEIMELYERKIAILTKKEQELQNYVEVKTVALQKADRIMTQYKCRQADSDAEALRLRTMLKDFESRCESAVMKFEEAQSQCNRQKDELDAALFKLKELQQQEKELQDLMQVQMSRQYEQKKSFEEERTKLSELLNLKDSEKKVLINQLQQVEEDMKMKCKDYEVLEESRDDLLRKNEELKKSTEKVKQNLEEKILNLESAIDSAQQSILELETKNENLINETEKRISELENCKVDLEEQLKLKDGKLVDLGETINKLNVQITEKNNLLKESELTADELKCVLDKTENENSKLKQDIKMLELLCKRYEATIEKKDCEIKEVKDELHDVRENCEEEIEGRDKQIKLLQEELEKMKYITGMIHQITSGKIPPPKSD